MSNLFQPTKQDRAALRRGAAKQKLRQLINDKKVAPIICPICEQIVYKFKDENKMLTTEGTVHKHTRKINYVK